MKAIAVNASPRKNGNTSALLDSALKGAQGQGCQCEKVNLIDLSYSGCISCFSCKKLDAQGGTNRMCAVKDELRPLLAGILDCDVLLVGSPIYISDVTGMWRNFYERLVFMLISYGRYRDEGPLYSVNTGLFYTTNAPEPAVQAGYYHMFEGHAATFKRVLGGEMRIYAATDTWQFDDYSKYDSSMFDAASKAKRREEQWPKDLEAAFAIGEDLARAALK